MKLQLKPSSKNKYLVKLPLLLIPNCYLCNRDNIPIVSLQELPLEAELFDDGILHGIKPTLFADDPEAAGQALLANQDLARRDICKLQKLLFAPETVPPELAQQVLK